MLCFVSAPLISGQQYYFFFDNNVNYVLLNGFLRMEINGTMLAESEKRTVDPAAQYIEYDFTHSFPCCNAVLALSDIPHKPVIVTLIEVVPEKKKVEAKSIVLAQAVIDLLPLLQGQCSFSCTVALHATNAAPEKGSVPPLIAKHPILDVCVSASAPLLTEEQLATSNLMKVSLETAYSLPDTFNQGFGPTAPPYICTQVADMWALDGHCHYLCGSFAEAQGSYERSLDFPEQPLDNHLVLLRLGSIYLQERKVRHNISKMTYLRACEKSPSCLTWLGLGISCYRLDELWIAEEALTEANHLNNQNAEVWAYLALICLRVSENDAMTGVGFL
uniref:Cilia and flagella associated protein 70 n=1 Tax=Hippocampus comes TaxID=109280 RepID=A0A3Q2Z8B4_HIPCM